ncbi:MAG: GMC family oxidoreductase N-terminal domain-containing protein, partial [Chlamydiales bacterium]|nr:GMC family oxidoreductase N-terminal domain-containing protein [Chlamydiales bacterium]
MKNLLFKSIFFPLTALTVLASTSVCSDIDIKKNQKFRSQTKQRIKNEFKAPVAKRQGANNVQKNKLIDHAQARKYKVNHHKTKDCSSSSSSHHDSSKYDYIIVGLGTAGAPLARYLSDNHHNRVLVLEAGSNLSTDPLVTIGGFDPAFAVGFQMLVNDAKYADTAFVADVKNFPAVFGFEQYSSGRMWGGSSAHNAMQSVRGTPDVYDQWDLAAGGSSIWSYNNLLPYMKGMENYAVAPGNAPIDAAQRGESGPLLEIQASQAVPPGSVPYYANFAAQTGGPNHIADGADYNSVTGGHVMPTDGQNLGTYIIQYFNTHDPVPLNRKRSFSIPAWISDVVTAEGNSIGKRNLKIVSNATVDRVLFDKNLKARKVHFIHNGQGKTAEATKKIILCAGCPGSSTILQRSGIGDPVVLAKAGVDCLVQNTNVGANLSQHYGVTCEMTLPAGVTTLATGFGFADASQTSFHNDFSAGLRQFQFFNRRNGPFNLTAPLIGALGLAPASTVEIACWNLRPKSKGTAFILDNDPFSK